jgi:hypothetical protein
MQEQGQDGIQFSGAGSLVEGKGYVRPGYAGLEHGVVRHVAWRTASGPPSEMQLLAAIIHCS